MPHIELMAKAHADDPEQEVRGRVVKFLTSRGYRTTPDPSEFTRGSLFGSLTGFSPKKWAVTVRFKAVEPGMFWYRFLVDTTGQSVTAGERRFWDDEKSALEDAIAGRLHQDMAAADQRVAVETQSIFKSVLWYSIGGALLFGGVPTILIALGMDIQAGLAAAGAGAGAGIGAAFGAQRIIGKTHA